MTPGRTRRWIRLLARRRRAGQDCVVGTVCHGAWYRIVAPLVERCQQVDNAENTGSSENSENKEDSEKRDNKGEFWAQVTMVAVSPVAIAAGLAKGAYDASTDHGSFVDGFTAGATPVIRAGRNFGEEHGPQITRGVVGGAAGAVGVRIVQAGLRHLRL